MSSRHSWDRVQEIFLAALEIPATDRPSFLAETCDGDAALERELRSLLDAHNASGALPELHDESDPPRLYGLPCDCVGPYKIVRPLGQGGMGTVFLASRSTDDLTQVVALKLLRADFASERLIERFRNERRILARLQHPGIARLIDAGATESGQPFFAMEFVEGVDIMSFVKTRRLSIPERLRLFLEVCDAVEYAHRQLVVHRDLKPSNILVGDDGRPKLLDFGIAKLVSHDDDDPSQETTRTGRFFTPDYASPEQVRGEPVATPSDVYALGVLLYQLLAETRPLDLQGRTPAGIERAVCHEQPRRPSERVNDSRRRREIAGDLDTIVLKAIAKEPNRRYGGVGPLGDDVRRHLDRKPVRARPDRWTYRTSKFVQRHRAAAIATVFGLLSLSVGVGSIAWQGAVARRERDRAEDALRQSQDVTRFLTGLFQAADPVQAGVDTATARAILRRGVEEIDALQDQPLLQARLLDALSTVFLNLGELTRAHEMTNRSLRLRRTHLEPGHPDLAKSLRNLGRAQQRLARYEEAEAAYLEALTILHSSTVPIDSNEIALTLDELGFLMPYLNRLEESLEYYKRALDLREAIHDPGSAEVTASMMRVGLAYRRSGEYVAALEWIRRSVNRYRDDPNADPAQKGTASFHLADVIAESGGDSDEAEALYREGIDLRRSALPFPDPGLNHGLENLGRVLSEAGRHREAESLLREALEINSATFGANTPAVAYSLTTLGTALARGGKLDEAVNVMRRSLEISNGMEGGENVYRASTLSDLGLILTDAGRYDEADVVLRESVELRAQLHGPDHTLVAQNLGRLGRLYTYWGRYSEAEEHLLRAASIVDTRFGSNQITVRTIHRYLADLYEQMGDSARAASHSQLSR